VVASQRAGPESQADLLGMFLSRVLDKEGLKLLCQRIDVDYGALPGTIKAAKIKGLLGAFTRDNRVPELLRTIYELLQETAPDRIPPEFIAVVFPDETEVPVAKVPAVPEPARFDCETTYTVYGSGDVTIDGHVTPTSEGLPFLPRIGLQMTVPGEYETFTWYGRGPHETYVDRKEGAWVDIHSGTVDEQYVPYVVPEENGNKTDVRWVTLTNDAGVGLLATGSPVLEVSAHHYTTQDLTGAQHTYELIRREDITLNLDYAQSGLGSASCGPGRLEKYQLQPEEVCYRVRLRPFSAEVTDPMSLSKIVLPEL